jgi:hypothetical protein
VATIRHGQPSVIERIEKGEVVDPTSYYFRINPLFETSAAKYDWINRAICEQFKRFDAVGSSNIFRP